MRRFMRRNLGATRIVRCFVGPLCAWLWACGGAAKQAPEPAGKPPVKEAKEAGRAPAGHCGLEPVPEKLSPPALDRKAEGPSEKNLKAWVEKLSDVSLEGRYGGSVSTKKVAFLLSEAFLSFGLGGPPEDEEMCRPFDKNGVRDQNVVAHLQGNCPKGCNTIVIGAHYDGQGMDTATGRVFPSADDNASGVAALMETARLSGLRRDKLRWNLVLIAFGAEERNVLGAKAYVERPTVNFKSVELMINMDMVGRPLLDGVSARRWLGKVDNTLGYAVSSKWGAIPENWMLDAARRAGVRVIGIPEELITSSGYSSDSVPFSDHVPTVFFSTGIHADYHAPTDTADKFDAGQASRVVKIVLTMIEGKGYP